MTINENEPQAVWLRAISDPTRLAIIRLLATGGRSVTQVAAAFRAAAMTVSNHLKALHAAGVLDRDQVGRCYRYALRAARVEELSVTLTHASGMAVTIPLA